MTRPNPKFSNIESKIDHGKKASFDNDEDCFKVTRAKGENYGRIAPKVLAQYILDGKTALNMSRKLNDV